MIIIQFGEHSVKGLCSQHTMQKGRPKTYSELGKREGQRWGQRKLPRNIFYLHLNNNSSNLECQSPECSLTINTA